MAILKFIQWAMGLMVSLYILKGLLGKFQEGDFSKAGIIAVIWLALLVFTSGFIKIE
jgi:short subunit fatty acids transporter